MLDLSPVTLLFVETRAHEITKRVIDDCLSKASFGEVLIFTDAPERIPVAGARYIPCVDFPNKREAGKFYYSEAMNAVETPFALMLEWDAGIADVSAWRPEFFDYDYIGAPWTVRPNDPCDVGNGGFTLMSQKLGRFICQNRRQWPVYTDMDVCRLRRPMYEQAGFKWPTRDLAAAFAWELTAKPDTHFGYHATFTWPYVLPKEEVLERAKLMTRSPYLISKMGPLFKHARWLEEALPGEDLQRFINAGGQVFRSTPAHVFANPQQRINMQRLLQERRAQVLSLAARGGQKA